MTKEVMFPITKETAMQCLATSPDGDYLVEVARPIGQKYLPAKPMPKGKLAAALDRASGLICICNDEKLPGYKIAFYDEKRDHWVRLRTNQSKLSAFVAIKGKQALAKGRRKGRVLGA